MYTSLYNWQLILQCILAVKCRKVYVLTDVIKITDSIKKYNNIVKTIKHEKYRLKCKNLIGKKISY